MSPIGGHARLAKDDKKGDIHRQTLSDVRHVKIRNKHQNDLQSPLNPRLVQVAQSGLFSVKDLTCLLQPWSVGVQVLDPNAGGRSSLAHLD